MRSIEKDLQELCIGAEEYGAVRAAVISADQVVIDPRVRLKCLVPVCPHYGFNLMCPPRVMDPEAFGRVIDSYSHGILIQFPIQISPDGFESLEEAMEDIQYSRAVEESSKQMAQALSQIERKAISMGYRFAAALAGGHCRLCDECVGQLSGERCKHPFKARPSMEALGIDVFQTAKNVGLPMEDEEPVWTTLLLVD